MIRAPFPVTKIAVGSHNPAKIEAVRLVAAEIWPAAQIIPVAVASGVPAMPLSDAQTLQGAVTRARAALAAADADLGCGLEGGIDRLPVGVFACGWAAVVDRQGRLGLGGSGRLPLPAPLVRLIEEGLEMGEAMDLLSGQHETRQGPGVVGILTGGLVSRAQAFASAVAYALAPFLTSQWYS